MHNFISILIAKIIIFGCKLFKKNGYQLPGYFVYDVFKDHKILTRLKYPEYVIAVTGSAGKGSSASLINQVLKLNNINSIYNECGNNGILGIISFILRNTKLNGKINCDVLVLECDERHLKLIFSQNKPTHLIITNVTRDQPTRNGGSLNIYKEINQIIDDKIKLYINGDDPLLSRLKYKYKDVTTFGIGPMKTDYKNSLLNNLDFAYCPLCHNKLVYDYYHYIHLGNFRCPKCDFKRGSVDFEGNYIDLEKQEMMINNNIIKLSKKAMYICYATVAAYSICSEILNDETLVVNALNNKNIIVKPSKEYIYNNRKIIMLDTKNENNSSYYQSINYIKEQKEIKSIIIGFEKVSRRYKHSDLSWLYDISFELLSNDKNIDKIFCIGKFRYDIATRLSYANIDNKKVVIVDNNELLSNYVDKSKGNIYTMVCYDMSAVIRKMVKNEGN